MIISIAGHFHIKKNWCQRSPANIVNMKRILIWRIKRRAKTVKICVAEGDGVTLPEFGGSKIEMDGEEFEMIRETDIVSSTVVPDKVKVAIKEHLAEIESLSKVEEESTLCLHCGRNFSNHGKLCHASNPVSNSCGWFMAVNQEPEIIPMEKFYYCEKDDCDYKSRLRRDVKSWNNVRKI